MPRGTLILVVGPSGAGKDTLISAASGNPPNANFLFPRRTITRPASAGEVHTPVDMQTFEAQERAGAFALSWRAHGLAYGIPSSIERDLASGKHVVANVSRTVIAGARTKFAPVRVIEITAAPATLAMRLKARGRETGAGIDERLIRRQDAQPDVTIVNEGSLASAVAAFIAALQG